MRKTAILVLFSLLAAAAIAAVGAMLLLNTAAGRNIVKSMIEVELSRALDHTITIGSLSGRLPSKVALRQISLSDESGEFANVDALTASWRPLALLRGHIIVDTLQLTDAQILRAPQSDQDDQGEALPTFAAPSLPKLRIEEFSLRTITVGEAIAGVEAVFHGSGKLDLTGEAPQADIAIESTLRDRLKLLLGQGNGDGELNLDFSLASPANGLLSSIIKSDGPVSILIKGAGAQRDFPINLVGDLGALGSVAADARATLGETLALDASGVLTLGVRQSNVSDQLGPIADFSFALTLAPNGGQLQLNTLKLDALQTSGIISWRNKASRLASGSLALNVGLSGERTPALAADLLNEFTIDAAIDRAGKDYQGTLQISSAFLDVDATRFQSDLRNAWSGPLSLRLKPGAPVAAPFDQSFEASAVVTLVEEKIRAETISVILGEAGRYRGSASFNTLSAAFQTTGDLSLEPGAVAQWAPTLAMQGPARLRVDLEGDVTDFALKLSGELPALAVAPVALQGSMINVDINGLPLSPVGVISGRSLDGKGSIIASIATEATGEIRLKDIIAKGPGYALTGDVGFLPETKAVSWSLRYEGANRAAPLQGLIAEGALASSGRLSAVDNSLSLSLATPSFQVNEFTARDLTLEMSGALDANRISLKLGSLSGLRQATVSDLALDGLAVLSGAAPTLDVNSVSMAFDELKIRSRSPFQLRFGDGIAADGVDLDIGEMGRLQADFTHAPKRWTAEVTATGITAPNVDVVVDARLSLDTNRPDPAEARIDLRSSIAGPRAAPIVGAVQWRDDRITLRYAGDDKDIHFDIAGPLKLVRGREISVDTQGSLTGAIRLKSDISPYADLLPQMLQTLEGVIETSVEIGGVYERPLISGHLNLLKGSFTEITSGVSIVDLEAQATASATADGFRVAFSGAAAGPGQSKQTIKAQGTIEASQNASIDTVITLDGARFSGGPVRSATASGTIQITGPTSSPLVTGAINVAEIDAVVEPPPDLGLTSIDVVFIENGEAPASNQVEARAPSRIAFDIDVAARDRIFVRGRGLDSEWQANVSISGDALNPIVLGTLERRRGFIDFSGRRFTLTEGKVVFERLTPNDPVLALRAEYETREGVVAAIVISGRASTPIVRLDSSPVLPSEDIMALVLFGKPATELSAIESLQMAQGLASLSGIGPFGGGGGGVRRSLGLDMLNVDLDASGGGGSLSVGKYVADGLFISATQDIRGERGSVRVEYEISNSISIETELRQDGDQTISANWKKEF